MKKILNFAVFFSVLMLFCLSAEESIAQTWQPTNGPFGGTVYCFTQNDTYLFAGVGGGVFGKGIFRTSDNGANWTAISNGLSSAPMGKEIDALVTMGSYVIAATGAGLFRSSNNGDSWSACNYTGFYIPTVLLTDGVKLFAGGSSGFWVSTDNGVNWTDQNSYFPAQPQIRSMAISGGLLYIGTYGRGVYRSTNSGDTVFVTVNTGFGTVLNKTISNLGVNGTDVFAGTMGQGVFRLLDNGTTWTNEVSNLPTGSARVVQTLIVKDNSIFIGGNAGLFRSNNTGTMSWAASDGNLPVQQFSKLIVRASNIFTALNTKGVFISGDNSNTWTEANHGLQGLSTRLITHGTGADLFASTYEGMVYRSSDLGASWIMGTTRATAGPCLKGSTLFVGLDADCWRSNDYGATWTILPGFLGPAYTLYVKGDTLFAGTSAETGAYYSTDNGDNWNPTSGIWNLNPAGGYPTVKAIASHGQKMYAGTLNGIFKSTDNGLTWTSGYPAMGNFPINDLAIKGDTIFAATGNGVLISTDDCLSWLPVNNGLLNTNVGSLLFNGTTLFAGTAAGIFSTSNYGVNWIETDQGFSSLPNANSLAIQGNYLFCDSWLVGQPVYRRELTGSPPQMPSPITGTATPCVGSSQTYSVINVPGVTYTWQFPSGWTVTSGGNSNSVTVTVGNLSGIILVTPSNGWGTGPSQYLTVNPAAVVTAGVTINVSLNNICAGTPVTFTPTPVGGGTAPAYQWFKNSVQVSTAGTYTYVPVNGDVVYAIMTSSSPCATGSPATSNSITMIVGPTPIPTITGVNSVCVNSGYYTYSTEAGFINYIWTISAGGTITGGSGTNQVQVTWNTAGAQTISVNYSTAGGCQASSPTVLNVTVNSLPLAAGSITGPASVCAGEQGITYSVPPVSGAVAYAWTLPNGATIVSGANTNSITVDFADNAVSGPITVSGNNLCGNGPSSSLTVTVNPIPPTPSITANGYVLSSNAVTGNQWYHDGNAISGATGETYTVPTSTSGWFWTVVTLNGCSSDSSNHIYIQNVGISETTNGNVNIYPVPNDGHFNIIIRSENKTSYKLDIYNSLGVKIYGGITIIVNGTSVTPVELGPVPGGLYTVILRNAGNQVIRKILVAK